MAPGKRHNSVSAKRLLKRARDHDSQAIHCTDKGPVVTDTHPAATDDRNATTDNRNATTEPQFEGARLNYRDTMSYGDYLGLDTLLAAQKPLSPDHNEMLFLIVHQTSELWMKLMLHELRAARAHIADDQLPSAFKMLARVSRIFEQLVHSWSVLATMTPPEYTALRPYLGSSSGFQSHQYRCIEFLLGNKNPVLLKAHEHRPDLHAIVEQSLNEPSLYDETIRLLSRNGLAIDEAQLNRDWSKPRPVSAVLEEAWLTVYRDPKRYWNLYELAEELVDLEDAFRLWRFRHVTTVERIIGFKTGTGGTAGVAYLRKMLDVVLFPELWKVRTEL